MTDNIIKAILFASERHNGQLLGDKKLPYITHPIIVSELLRKYKTSKKLETLIISSLLHETLKNTETDFVEIASKFSPSVAKLVLELTSDNDEIKKIGETDYLKKKLIGMSSYALVIKLVSILSVVLNNPTEKYTKDISEILKYVSSERKLSKTHKRIIEDILATGTKNNMIVKAILFASEKHNGQIRRESGLPYVTHPIIVSELLRKYKTSKKLETLIVASLLHDILEDTETDFVEIATAFSPMVASLVLELTSDNEEIQRIGKNEYLKRKLLGLSSYGLVIKLVDRLSNVLDNPTEKYKKATIELMDFIANERKLSKTHKKIVKDILEVIKTS